MRACSVARCTLDRVTSALPAKQSHSGVTMKRRTAEDDIGVSFNRLTVTSLLPRDSWATRNTKQRGAEVIPTVTAVCRCGGVWVGSLYALRSGATKSCGCLVIEASMRNKPGPKHGMTKSPEYSVYRSMLKRCYTLSHKSYARYGGRGVTVCDRWRESFENFYADMGPRPSKSHSLDRVDNESGYSPDNCRWASAEEQANNRRGVNALVYRGKTYSISQLARLAGMHRRTLTSRLMSGWSVEDAVNKEVADKRTSKG